MHHKMGLHEALIATWFDKTFFRANGRMLSKDPVKRGLNSYRYCDNDPADYVDPTGEIAHILWGIGLGGAFGFGGGFLSSAVSQKASGGEIDWKEALGSGINGLITGATQGGLLASGAGIPAALFANTLAGTAGSAAEQYIGSGKIDARKSITSGLNNAVSNAIYGTRPLGSMKEAFGRGVGAGAATSALNYISDTLGEKTLHSRMGMGLLSGMTGAAFSPYNFLRNPRRGCGSPSPFVPSLGYGSARGYQYDLPKIESGSQSQSKRFSFKDLLLEMVIGGVTGGLSSAAFYGAGKGIERLKDGLRPSRGGTGHGYSVDSTMFPDDEAAGVLRNGEYVKNPTAHSINDYISEGSNYLGSKNMNGQYMYVVDMEGNIIIGTRGGQRMPHPTLVGGNNPQVQAAGMVEIRGGKIYSINNASGHFKPSVESLGIAEDAFSNLPQNIFSKVFQGYLSYGE